MQIYDAAYSHLKRRLVSSSDEFVAIKVNWKNKWIEKDGDICILLVVGVSIIFSLTEDNALG